MDCVAGKLFVGGLKRETSEETLEQYFSKYGQVKDCQIMKNWYGGAVRSRGFGFVTFVEPFHAHQAIHDCTNPIIDGKMVEVKPALPRDAYTGVNVYNAYNTGFELGFGTSVTMNGFGSSSGTYHPWVNPYNYGGLCYYYCPSSPFVVPLANCNFVAPCFCGASMYTGWNRADHGGADHYYVSEERVDHVNYRILGVHRNSGVNDCVGNEELGDHANPFTPGGANDKRADHANSSTPRGANDTVGNKELDDHVNFSAPRGENNFVGNEERANHGDPGPKDSGGDISSRSNGNDERSTKITMRVHPSNTETLITKSNGLDNHNGAVEKCEVILPKQYSG